MFHPIGHSHRSHSQVTASGGIAHVTSPMLHPPGHTSQVAHFGYYLPGQTPHATHLESHPPGHTFRAHTPTQTPRVTLTISHTARSHPSGHTAQVTPQRSHHQSFVPGVANPMYHLLDYIPQVTLPTSHSHHCCCSHSHFWHNHGHHVARRHYRCHHSADGQHYSDKSTLWFSAGTKNTKKNMLMRKTSNPHLQTDTSDLKNIGFWAFT